MRARLLEMLGDEIGVADDRGQQVVEVVGDSAGQTADGFHLLRVAQLFVAVVEQARGLPGPQRVADRALELRADHVLLDVVRRARARCLFVERQAAVSGDAG